MAGGERHEPGGQGGAGQAGAEEGQREGRGQLQGGGEALGTAALADADSAGGGGGGSTGAASDTALGARATDAVAALTGTAGGDQHMGGGGPRSLVIDAELVGVDRDEEGRVLRLRAFQDLSTRARGAISEAQVRVYVSPWSS